MDNEFEMRTDALNYLSIGDIWGTRRRGVFVVLAVKPANWHGDDVDVYSHIDQWLTCRPATPTESEKWDRAVIASTARNQQRRTLGIDNTWQLNGDMLVPPAAATRMLDSYDDRWEPPRPIALTGEQVAIEHEYNEARAGLRVS